MILMNMESQSPGRSDSDSPLHVAIRQHNTKAIRKILDEKTVNINCINFKRQTPLQLACILGLSDILWLLVAFGADVFYESVTPAGSKYVASELLYHDNIWLNDQNSTDGDTDLHVAVREKDIEKIHKILTEHDMNIINSINVSHETPLHLACALGLEKVVHLLITKGAEVSMKDLYNNAPIHRAAAQGHVHIVEALITEYECDPMIRGYQGRTLLHYACGLGNCGLVNLLFQIQKDDFKLLITDASKLTPVHIAALYGQEKIFELLIKHYECDPADCSNVRKQTPLYFACKKHHKNIIKMLAHNQSGDRQLYLAVSSGNIDVVKTLINEFGIDPNTASPVFKGRTLLHQACITGNVDLVKMFIFEYNFDPLCFDKSGCTPFHLAALHGRNDIIRLVITKLGGDIVNFSHEEKKITPLHCASTNGHFSTVEMLVSEYKADINARRYDDKTALHLAAENGHLDLVKSLIDDFKCDPNDQDEENQTILHMSCKIGQVDLVRMLISDFKLDLASFDRYGNTALHTAALYRRLKVIEVLINEYNCSKECTNQFGQTILHIACSKGDIDLCDSLISVFNVNCNTLDKLNDTPLNVAINGGNVELVHKLSTQYNCKANIQGCESKPLLHQLCAGGFTTILQTLIQDYNFDIALIDSDGNTLLHIAAMFGKDEIVRVLIMHCCGHSLIDSVNIQGLSALQCAAVGGCMEVLKAMVEEFGSSPSYLDSEGRTLLHLACFSNSTDLINLLITEFKLDPMSLDNSGNTPLHCATLSCQEVVVGLLITKYNCPIDCRNKREEMPLHIACSNGGINIFRMLVFKYEAIVKVSNVEVNSPLHHAALSGHTNIVKILITEFGWDAKAQGHKGRTLLHQACANGHTELTETLIQTFKLDLSLVDDEGNTPLHVAALYGQTEVAKLLITEYNCQSDSRNTSNQTILHIACSEGHIEFCSELISMFDADYSATDDHNNTPFDILMINGNAKGVHMLHAVALRFTGYEKLSLKPLLHQPLLHQVSQKGYVAMLQELVTEFAHDPASVDENGNTILHAAASYGQERVVEMLVTKYKKYDLIDKRNYQGQTPLHCACVGDHAIVALLLVSHGADIGTIDITGYTPLKHASMLGHEKVIQAILSNYGFNSCIIDSSLLHQILCKAQSCRALVDVLLSNFNDYDCCKLLLHTEAYYSNEPNVRLLLTKYKYPVERENGKGQTALHIACSQNALNVKLCQTLISDFNAPRNALDNELNSPLNMAIKSSNAEAVHILVTKFNCKAYVKGYKSELLLHQLCVSGDTVMLQTLISKFGYDSGSIDENGNSLLHIAAMYGRDELLEMLLMRHLDSSKIIDCANSQGQTPLHLACVHGHGYAAKVLVRHNADITVRNKHHQTPFKVAFVNGKKHVIFCALQALGYGTNEINSPFVHNVCKKGDTTLLDLMLSDLCSNPFSFIDDKNGNTLLHTAALHGNGEAVRLLLNKHKYSVKCTNKFGQTVFHIACSVGNVDLCHTLKCEFHADSNFVDKMQDTPLNKAIKNGHTKLVHVLARLYGCKANVKICKNKPLLHQLCGGGYDVMLKKLISEYKYDPATVDDDGNTLLHTAAQLGKHEMVELLIVNYSHQISINAINCRQQTALHCACIFGFADVAKVLVSHNVDITIKDADGHTPLRRAVVTGHRAIVYDTIRHNGFIFNKVDSVLLHQLCASKKVELMDVLLSDPAIELDPSSVKDSPHENTLLHTAVLSGDTEMARMLISKYNCPVDCINKDGQTPLHLVCSSTPINLVDSVLNMLVFDFYADINSRDNLNNHPISLAVQAGRTNLMEILLLHGIDPNVRGYKNQTLLHIACAAGHKSIAEILVRRFHLSTMSTDSDGNTPLHLSSICGQSISVELLLFKYNVPIFVRNKSGRTAIDLARDDDVKLVFKQYMQSEQNKIQSDYRMLQNLSQQKYSGSKSITRVFIVGNSGSGKSTLIKSLQERRLLSYYFSVPETDVQPNTTGIVPSPPYHSKDAILLYYDFAGHREYYSSHAAILEQISQSKVGSCVYLIVANLSKDDCTLRNEIGYWLSFISYNTIISDHQDKLKVIIILSHADLYPGRRIDDIQQFLIDHSNEVSKDVLEIVTVVPINCRKPRSSKIVEDHLQEISKTVPPYSLSLEAVLLHGILKKDFLDVVACKFQDLLNHIKLTGIQLPLVPDMLYPIIKELHDIGELMIIERSKDKLENCLILLSISKLTNETHEILFSESSKQSLASKTNKKHASMGILPEDYLKDILPEYISIQCLIQLQYCQEFNLAEVGLDYSIVPNDSSSNTLLYFPALCNLTRQEANWPIDPSLTYSVGWYAKTKGSFDCFPPRFLHVLLLRLAFIFALPAASCQLSSIFTSIENHNRRCTMWSNGIQWLVCDGVECIVEVVNENKGVVGIVKSREKHAYECLHMLTLIIEEVSKTKAEFCSSVSLQGYFMKADCPSSFSNGDKLYDMKEVESGLKKQENTVVSISGKESLDLDDLRSIPCHTYWGELSL